MIENAPIIKISGIKYPIYSADFSWGGADRPSSLSVSFVNESGAYEKPRLGTYNSSKIEIGSSFNFIGYPISYTSSKSSRGNLLSITYQDGSILLDKIFVGLKGVHGAAPPNVGKKILSETVSYGTFNNVLLLGQLVDPCEDITDDYVDPCNPCADETEFQSVSNSNTQKRVDCQVSRMTQFLDVIYTFNDLILGLKSKGVSFYNVPVIKSKFYGRYSGSAREVLKSWCEDIGLSFVWHLESVYFVDIKTGIKINDTSFYEDCALQDYSESESIENNKSNGVILYFGAEGRLENYSCSAINPYRMSLIPITLKDLFYIFQEDGFGASPSKIQPYIRKYYSRSSGSSDANIINRLEESVHMSKYSKVIRDMNIMSKEYDSISTNFEIPLLGMTIQSYWNIAIEPSSTKETALKKIFYENIPESIKKMALESGAKMCVIKYDENVHNNLYSFEKKLADEFVGRYWISYFSKGESFSYSSPDGEPRYFDAGTPNTLPFIDFIPTSSRGASVLIQGLVNDSAQKNKSSSHVGAVETTNPNSFARSFLLLDRAASWEPTTTLEDGSKINKDIQDFYFLNVPPFKLEGSADSLGKDEFYCLIFNTKDKFLFELEDRGYGDHPIEKENENLITSVGSFISSYGLRSARCFARQLKVSFNPLSEKLSKFNYSVNFYMPPQTDGFGSSQPGYIVIASPSRDSENKDQKVLIKKKEVIFGDVPAPSPQSVAIRVDYKDLSNIITGIIGASGGVCQYNENEIKSIISEYYTKTSRTKSVVSRTVSYSIGGFPTRELTVLDGLSSMSIRYNSSNGITTDLSFSNSPPISPSSNLENAEFQRNMIKRLSKRKMITSEDKIIV